MARGNGRRDKTPKAAFSPLPKKQVPPQKLGPTFRGRPMSWRFNAADRNGPFAWSNLADGDAHKEVIETLASLETMTEGDLGAKGCHFIETPTLCKEARDRLAEIQLDDLDELYSIRITGRTRIFCVHREDVLSVLWYDPDHAVCPSNKKHT